MTTLSASDIAARRIHEARTERRWTVKQLAERCEKAGASQLTAAVITNLESRRRATRELTVDELLALALVLEVPPLQLLAPLGPDEAIEVVPGEILGTLDAAGWLADDDAAAARVHLAGSPRPEDTERILRDTGSPLTVVRQIRSVIRQIGIHDGALTGDLPHVAGSRAFHKNSIATLGLRLMHLTAALEVRGHAPPPLDGTLRILARHGLPVTLEGFEQASDFGPGWED